MSETRCIFVGTTAPRVLPDRHLSDCGECDCPGCQPCKHDHCAMDGRTHLDVSHPLHCPECVGSVRDDLTEIRDLCTHLRERALTGSDAQGRRFASMHLPGGDPLVIHGPVGDGSADQRLRWAPVYDPEHPAADENGFRAASDDDNGHNGSLELPGDPEPPALTLGTWEDAWRKWLGHSSGPRFDYAGSVAYLMQHLTMMAQALDRTTAVGLEFAPDFGEFARDIRRLRRHLEAKLADGDRAEVTRTPCLDCGARLVKVYTEKAKDDHHKCPRCRRVYPPRSNDFARAQHQAMVSEGADAWIPLTDAAKSIGRSPHTLRTWTKPRHRSTVKVRHAGGTVDTNLINSEHLEPLPADHPPKCRGCVMHPNCCIGCLSPRVRTDRELIEGDGGSMVKIYVWWPDVRHADAESGRRSRSA